MVILKVPGMVTGELMSFLEKKTWVYRFVCIYRSTLWNSQIFADAGYAAVAINPHSLTIYD